MDRSILIEIVQEQRRNLLAVDIGTQRESLKEVQKALGLPHVIAITGMRRCGKSTLMLQALNEGLRDQIYYLDFEDERLIDFTVNDFNMLYEVFIELYGERKIFFFDEIQIIDHWESFVRRMYKEKNKFIITGSSAELLSSELSTKLTGRHVDIELLPFSFREYLAFTESKIDLTDVILTKERGLLKKAFNHYLRNGGIPEYLKYNDPIIMKGIYENILYKDVIVRYEIKAVKALRELSLQLLSNPGSLISYSKLKNSLQLGSVNTVKNYIHYLGNSYLIFTVDKYSHSVRDQTVSQKKVYAIDTGLIECIGFQFSKNLGRYLENVVYLELRRRYDSNVYYYKTKDNFEVDFCVRQGREVISLIQVCNDINDSKTLKREVRALTAAMDELGVKEGLIITLDQFKEIKSDGKVIKVVSILNWLLEL